jgi:hypothetical protein
VGFHPVPRAPATGAELRRTAPGKPAIRCGFCGGRQDEVDHMVKGRTSALICDLCVDAAALVIAEARA